MSFTRRHSRPDSAQEPIVEALREAGVKVWVIGKPCDLLTLYEGRWLPLEVKSDTSSARNRKDQDKQRAFLAETGVSIVTTPTEALASLRRNNPAGYEKEPRRLTRIARPTDSESVARSRKSLTAKDSQHV